MIITNLEEVKTELIVQCLTKSFEGYFVEMPSDVNFWIERFKNTRVDKSHSWGVFDDNNLVGFVINAVDENMGILTAYNGGTGVLPTYRGNHLVDKMYQFGIERLKKNDIKRCSLEVIDKNDRAISVYKRIGFRSSHKLNCYKGELQNTKEAKVEEVMLYEINSVNKDKNYSWDNTTKTIDIAGVTYKAFKVFETTKNAYVGYFIINPLNGYIAQLETETNNWKDLFAGISQINTAVRINNIKEDRTALLSYLTEMNFENTINQLYMEMNI